MGTLELNKDYWDERYKKHEIGWDIGYASPAIVAYATASIPKSATILIPGCGNAHEARALLFEGFTNLTLLDIAPTLVRKVQKQFDKTKYVRVVCQDFFLHTPQYDYILEQTFFCALHPSLREKYVEQMASLLHPGGTLAGLLFNRTFERKGPPFGGNIAEYQKLFNSLFDIVQMRPCADSISQRQGSELFIELRKK